jgi:hypothetical protein
VAKGGQLSADVVIQHEVQKAQAEGASHMSVISSDADMLLVRFDSTKLCVKVP